MTKFTEAKSVRISYVSPWLFAAAGLLLVFIIGVFAINNYQREKVVMGKALFQEGQAILNLTVSAAKGALREKILDRNLKRDEWIDEIQKVIENGSGHPQIMELYLVDETGRILANSNTEKINTEIDEATQKFLEEIDSQNPIENMRFIDVGNDRVQMFQIARFFFLFGNKKDNLLTKRDFFRRHGPRMMRDPQLPGEFEDLVKEISQTQLYLVADMDMTDYQNSVKKQLVQVIILSFVLLLVGLGGFISMITLQGYKGSQRRLRHMSQFTDVLVASMPVGIVALDAQGEIQTCNASCRRMLGISPESAQSKDYRIFFPEEIVRFITDSAAEHFSEGKEIEIEINGIRKVLSVVKVALEESSNHNRGIMILIQDLTTQKKLEFELRRNERHTALGKMAAGVAHELRNPLSSIKGLALLLRNKSALDASSKEATDVMIFEVERLDRSISELLDYARPENLDMKNIDLNMIVRRAVMLIEADAIESGIEITHVPAPGECNVKGDQDRLTQVFLNLFLNSIQAMRSGGILSVKTMQDHGFVHVEVKDEGEGIADEVIDKIFDPYFTTKNEGTGLGLSISAKIIEDHMGSVTFKSIRGTGTTVTVSLPV